jgi:hypothetical protein
VGTGVCVGVAVGGIDVCVGVGVAVGGTGVCVCVAVGVTDVCVGVGTRVAGAVVSVGEGEGGRAHATSVTATQAKAHQRATDCLLNPILKDVLHLPDIVSQKPGFVQPAVA